MSFFVRFLIGFVLVIAGLIGLFLSSCGVILSGFGPDPDSRKMIAGGALLMILAKWLWPYTREKGPGGIADESQKADSQ